MFRTWNQHLHASLFGTPLQNVDVDIANAPAFHFEFARFVKIDGVGSDQGGSVIVNDVFLARAANSKPGPDWKHRPVRGGAHDETSRQVSAESVARTAFFLLGVGGGSHIAHATQTRVGCFDSGQRFLDSGRLLSATDEKTNSCESYCKVKAF